MRNQQFSFIVRLRVEMHGSEGDTGPSLRGSIQQVGSEQIKYFSSFERLPELLKEFTCWVVKTRDLNAEGHSDLNASQAEATSA